MVWKNFKLGKKFTVAFGIIIVILTLISIVGALGLESIMKNTKSISYINHLKGDISQKHIDHLKWVKELNNLLIDDHTTKLNVEIDPHKCRFGTWYYSEERKNVEEMIPELKELFAEIEEPHKLLHESAKNIDAVFIQANRKLSEELYKAKTDHLKWINNIKDILIKRQPVNNLNIEKNPEKCNFGKWLNSEHVQKLRNNSSDISVLLDELIIAHSKLHKSAITIENLLRANKISSGINYYMNNTQTTANDVLDKIDKIILWNDISQKGMEKANEIYLEQTMTQLNIVGNLLNKIEEIYNQNINKIELSSTQKSSKTRNRLILFSSTAILFSILIALVLSKGILKPILSSVKFTQKIAEGDLTVNISIEQEDEIGTLAKSLKSMQEKLTTIVSSIIEGSSSIASASLQLSSTSQLLSQGASEQAASVEEISSTIEEISSNIEQNTENAKVTEQVSVKAQEGINEVSSMTSNALSSTKEISEKIKIVNDIAFQTNILALNAAIEAARAGEHGKGFAVVAAEVRKLAESSKQAADQIVKLTQESFTLAEESETKMANTLPEINKTTRLVQEISAASIEQNNGVMQVNDAIQQLNATTQQNAASSEELATSSEELSGQAESLKELISFFKVNNSKLSSNHSFTNKKERLPDNRTEYNVLKPDKKFKDLSGDDIDNDFDTF